MKSLEQHAQEWEKIAVEREETAAYELTVFPPGHSVEVFHIQAALYRNVAKAMRMQIKDGIQRCACHLKTYEGCAEIARAAARDRRY